MDWYCQCLSYGGGFRLSASHERTDSDAEKGYIAIETGVIQVTSGGDAIQAETDVTITGGEITLSSGGGSEVWIDETLSAKGIKAAAGVTITGGILVIDSADDAIHANDSIVINGGTFTLASGDDGSGMMTRLGAGFGGPGGGRPGGGFGAPPGGGDPAGTGS